jgi:hypothetical protein
MLLQILAVVAVDQAQQLVREMAQVRQMVVLE